MHDAAPVDGFRHEAWLYAGNDAFLAATVPFVRAAVAAGEPIMVALPQPRLDLLRDALDGAADHVAFADMEVLGANPARIIPAWDEFVARHRGSGRRLRGIGEPIWAGRSEAELAECHVHESLLNIAFADAPPFWLACPYDTERLPAEVIRTAQHTHPQVDAEQSHRYDGSVHAAPLPSPPAEAAELDFDGATFSNVRRFVAPLVSALAPHRRGDLLLAVTETAANSVRHGGGAGVLRAWREHRAVVCEIADGGTIADPLAGRRRPVVTDRPGGWGMWIANQICDLVQVRTSPAGTVVRLHMREG